MVICMYALNELNSFDPGNELFDTFSEDLSFGFNEFYQIAFENELGNTREIHQKSMFSVYFESNMCFMAVQML